jgi:sulfite reductase beta subunit-like hemoprotein
VGRGVWGRDARFHQTVRIFFRSVPGNKTKALSELFRKEGYITEGFEHVPDIVACVGTTVCNLAVVTRRTLTNA